MAETETIPSPDTDQTQSAPGTSTEPVLTQDQPKHHPLSFWLALRQEFVTGKGSLDWLCTKHGVSMNTAKPRCTREKWVEKRTAWLIRQQAKLEPTPEPAPQQPKIDADITGLEQRISIIGLRIQEGEAALGQAENGKEFQSIATGLTHLYGIWALLTGHEKPGIRKTKPAKSRSGTVPVPEPE